MSNDNGSRWLRRGTPQGADWETRQKDYGTTLSPEEWDDHASEQSVRVDPPQPPEPVVTEPEAAVEDPAEKDATNAQSDDAQSDDAQSVDAQAGSDTEATPEGETAAEAPNESEPAGEETAAEAAQADETQTQETKISELEAAEGLTAEMPQASEASGEAQLPDDLYRPAEAAEATQEDAALEEPEDEEALLVAQLEAERQARDVRLGLVATSTENQTRANPLPPKRTTDKFLGSFGLTMLRLVTAGIIGIIGYQIVTDIDAASNLLAQTQLGSLGIGTIQIAWIVGMVLVLMALLLIVGMLQRVVGIGLLILSICSLAFIRWGDFSPFVADRVGFMGDLDLLLGAVGLLLFSLGGGSLGVDGAVRRARAKAKAEKE